MKKKLFIPLCVGLSVVIVIGSVLGIVSYNRSKTYVDVQSVSNISTMYYSDTSASEGLVTSNVSQYIYLEQDQQVSEVYVQTGDTVKIGDKLMSYDMALTELDLSDKQIDLKRTYKSIEKLNKELDQLRKGIVPTGGEDLPLGSNSAEHFASQPPKAIIPAIHQFTTEPGGESGSAESNTESEGTESETQTPETQAPETQAPETQTPETQAPETQAPETQTPETQAPETQTPETQAPESESESESENPDQPDTKPVKVLNWKTKIPDSKSPVIYVKSTTVIKPEFIYKVMGFDKKGEKLDPEKAIKVTLYLTDKKEWYTLKGDKLELPEGVPDKTTVEEYIENKFQFNIKEEPNNDDPFNFDDFEFDDYDEGAYYTQEEINEMITTREIAVETLNLHAKQDLLDIKKLEETLSTGVVTSTVNGQIKSVQDINTFSSDSDPFMVVESTEGLYLVSTINEYQLEDIAAGDQATITSWNSGMTFDATITEVSTYPSSNSYSYYGNTNLSYYPIKAYIENSEGLTNNEYVQLVLNSAIEDKSGHVFIEKSYVLEENGDYYVYIRDEKDRLKKQKVQVCGLLWGYYFEISEGLSDSDYIAFPYGKNIKDGVKTKEVEQIYY